jgi:hypothetical protein
MEMSFNNLHSEHMAPKEFEKNIQIDAQAVHKLEDGRVRDISEGKAFGPDIYRRYRLLQQLIEQSRLARSRPAQNYTTMIRTIQKEIHLSGINKAFVKK